jgi:hypothetical protein
VSRRAVEPRWNDDVANDNVLLLEAMFKITSSRDVLDNAFVYL